MCTVRLVSVVFFSVSGSQAELRLTWRVEKAFVDRPAGELESLVGHVMQHAQPASRRATRVSYA